MNNAYFEVRRSGIQGTGAFAIQPIPQGTWIIEYEGERISHEEADLRYDDASMTRHHTFLFVLDERECIDGSVNGNEAKFINHSCDPNCEAIYVPAEREIWIVARRDLEANDELTYDYGYEIEGEDLSRARMDYPCRCGAANCRGTILKVS